MVDGNVTKERLLHCSKHLFVIFSILHDIFISGNDIHILKLSSSIDIIFEFNLIVVNDEQFRNNLFGIVTIDLDHCN